MYRIIVIQNRNIQRGIIHKTKMFEKNNGKLLFSLAI